MTKYTALRNSRKNRVIVCEDLDFVWDEPELQKLATLWDRGVSIERISKNLDRDPDEILIALIHLARNDKIFARENGLRGVTTNESIKIV